MVIMVSRKWIAYFYIKPICNTVVKPTSEIVLEEFKIRFDDENLVFHGEISVNLDITDENEARKILADRIEKEVLPCLILMTNCGMEFNPSDINLRYEEAGTIGIVLSEVIKVHVVAEVSKNPEDFKRELIRYLGKIKGLDNIKEEWLLRALKFWNKGAVDYDPVDRFIYFYIALEIFVKRVLGYDDLNSYVIDEIREKYGICFNYEVEGKEWCVCDIRNNLFHGGASSTEKVERLERAVDAASKLSDRFGKDVLDLVKEFLNNNPNDSSNNK